MDFKRTFKRLSLIVALLGCSTFCMAQKQDFNRLVTAIATVESNLNEKVVSGDCVGYLQIRPVLVKECNNILKQRKSDKRFKNSDRLSKEKSIEMFHLIQEKYNPTYDVKRAICIWNAGPHSKRIPKKYLAKVMKAYNKL